MGCSQLSQYYLGFINISVSHVDVLSFVLGVVLTVATMYLVNCVRDNRKVNRHILGRGKTKFYNGGCGTRGEQEWVSPYSMHATPRAPPPMVSPDSATLPTAPYPGLQKSPVAIPWPSNAIQ